MEADVKDGEAGMKVWIDGEIVAGADARIPVTDHGLLYGDGVFEGIRVAGGRIFRVDTHLARLAASARALSLALPGGVEGVRRVLFDTVRAHGTADAYVRLLVTRGEGPLGVDPSTCSQPRLICIVAQLAVFSEEVRARGLDLLTSSYRRPPADVLDPRVKSLNYLNNALAKLEARQRGADDALLLNARGMVAEASVANVFVVRNDVLATPPATDGALEGVTRDTVLELAPSLGFATREATLGRFDLFAASECFLSGSGAGLVPVRSLDGRPIGAGGPGPVYEKVRAAFADALIERGTPF